MQYKGDHLDETTDLGKAAAAITSLQDLGRAPWATIVEVVEESLKTAPPQTHT